MNGHKIVDVHAHMCDPAFDADRGAVLARARSVGVNTVIAVGENLSDAKRNVELSKVHPELKPAAGLYPTCLDMNKADEMIAFIREERRALTAIGEVGLDHWAVREEADREVQNQIFSRFICLSLELDLPINVHSRSAGRHAVALLLQHNAERVLLHAFDGKASAAFPAVEAGYYFSIPPSIIRSRQKQKLVKQLPLACILIETDSPVLGPVAHERNEPCNAIVSVDAIAELKNLSRGEVLESTGQNALRLFGELGP